MFAKFLPKLFWNIVYYAITVPTRVSQCRRLIFKDNLKAPLNYKRHGRVSCFVTRLYGLKNKPLEERVMQKAVTKQPCGTKDCTPWDSVLWNRVVLVKTKETTCFISSRISGTCPTVAVICPKTWLPWSDYHRIVSWLLQSEGRLPFPASGWVPNRKTGLIADRERVRARFCRKAIFF